MPPFFSIRINRAKNPQSLGTGDCRKITRPSLQRLMREPGERARLHPICADTEFVGARDERFREHPFQDGKQCAILRAATA